MAKQSGQRFIKRNRPPRVHITYDDPTNAEEKIELPFVMGVMSDLSGNSPGTDKAEVENRKFLDVDMDNFEKRMEAIQPGISFRVSNRLSDATDEKMQINLRFNRMDDFKPAQVARQIPALAKLLEARDKLKNLQLYMDGRPEAEKRLRELLADPNLKQNPGY